MMVLRVEENHNKNHFIQPALKKRKATSSSYEHQSLQEDDPYLPFSTLPHPLGIQPLGNTLLLCFREEEEALEL